MRAYSNALIFFYIKGVHSKSSLLAREPFLFRYLSLSVYNENFVMRLISLAEFFFDSLNSTN